MSATVSPVPEGFHTVTPYLVVPDAVDPKVTPPAGDRAGPSPGGSLRSPTRGRCEFRHAPRKL